MLARAKKDNLSNIRHMSRPQTYHNTGTLLTSNVKRIEPGMSVTGRFDYETLTFSIGNSNLFWGGGGGGVKAYPHCHYFFF